jgi:hypothetical protein
MPACFRTAGVPEWQSREERHLQFLKTSDQTIAGRRES